MKYLNNTPRSEWQILAKRPVIEKRNLDDIVNNIIDKVRIMGDVALREFTLEFDEFNLGELKVSPAEIEKAKSQVSEELKQAISVAYNNIYKFHAFQKVTEIPVETMAGITCWRKNVGIENVGLSIAGASATPFSTIPSLVLTTQIA